MDCLLRVRLGSVRPSERRLGYQIPGVQRAATAVETALSTDTLLQPDSWSEISVVMGAQPALVV